MGFDWVSFTQEDLHAVVEQLKDSGAMEASEEAFERVRLIVVDRFSFNLDQSRSSDGLLGPWGASSIPSRPSV